MWGGSAKSSVGKSLASGPFPKNYESLLRKRGEFEGKRPSKAWIDNQKRDSRNVGILNRVAQASVSAHPMVRPLLNGPLGWPPTRQVSIQERSSIIPQTYGFSLGSMQAGLLLFRRECHSKVLNRSSCPTAAVAAIFHIRVRTRRHQPPSQARAANVAVQLLLQRLSEHSCYTVPGPLHPRREPEHLLQLGPESTRRDLRFERQNAQHPTVTFVTRPRSNRDIRLDRPQQERAVWLKVQLSVADGRPQAARLPDPALLGRPRSAVRPLRRRGPRAPPSSPSLSPEPSHKVFVTPHPPLPAP